MRTTEFSSSSSPSDRRVGALLRHLTAGACQINPSTYRLSSIFASLTSGVSSGSVFAHLVQAPEDPILGVPSSSSSMYPYVFGEAVLDELLVLELIKPHEDGVVSSIWLAASLSYKFPENEETVTTRENIKKRFTGQIMVTRIHVAINETSTRINDIDGQPIMTIA
ncbi:hypothetical protein YC2023_021099 [Brassica napus]